MRYGRLFSTLAVAAAANPLAALNELRAANGFPAGITENPVWSANCAAHMAYLERNGFRGNWHTEEPGKPGYSEAGRAAAGSAVLSNGPYVGAETDWEQWPYHFAQLLAPQLSVSGYAPGCIYTWPGYQRPEPPTLQTFTYPADGAGGSTSPYLYALSWGGGTKSTRLSRATLTGPGGTTALRVTDNQTEDADGALPPGGFLTPQTPLQDHTPYTAQVTVTSDTGAREVKRWSFSTGVIGAGQMVYGEADPSDATGALPSPRTPKVSLALYRTTSGGTQARITTRGLAIGRRARVTVRRLDCACRSTTRTLTLTRTTRRITSRGSALRVTVRVNGFWAGEIPFAGLTLTQSLS